MPQPVLFVGAATLDTIAMVEALPSTDERILAKQITHAGGGPAATAAVTAKRLGLDVEVIAAVGEDVAGALVRDSLGSEGIRTDLVEVKPDLETQTSLILSVGADGTRSIVTRTVSPLEVSEQQAERIRSAEWIHVDHLGWPAVEQVLSDTPLERRPRILVDAGNDLIGDTSACDVAKVYAYVPPIGRVNGAITTDEAVSALSDIPSEVAVITLGESGSVGRIGQQSAQSAGVSPDGFVSSLGAGDVFHGALTTALVREFDLVDALEYANCVAALSCRGLDGRSAIPTHKEVLTLLRKDQ